MIFFITTREYYDDFNADDNRPDTSCVNIMYCSRQKIYSLFSSGCLTFHLKPAC